MTRSGRGVLAVVAGLLLPACNLSYSPEQNLPGNVTGPPFILTIPLDGELQAVTNPQFGWNAYAGAVGYRLEVSAKPDFTEIVWDDPMLTITSTFVMQVTLTNFTTYYWRVHALLPSGPPVLAGGSPFHFRTQGGGLTTPSAFATQNPIDGLLGVVLQPPCAWQAAIGATSYTLQFDTDPNFPAPLVVQAGIHVNRATLATPLAPNTQYYWRVLATGQLGNRFSTAPPSVFTTTP